MSQPVRVLYVEDEPAARAAEALERIDDRFDVALEHDGQASLERLESDPVDCVVSADRLPDLDGLELLDRVRESRPDLPFILFTETERDATASEALDRGATDYLRKGDGPEQFRLLATRIGTAVDRYRFGRELDQYRSLVETVGDAMYMLDPDGTITFANEAMTTMLGRDREVVVGRHASETLGDDDFERGTALIREILADEDRDWGTFEVTVEPLRGDPFPAEINVAPLLDDGGSYQATVGVVRDMTDRKRREQRLSALHDTTRRLIEATTVDDAISIGIEAATGVLELDVAAFYRPTEAGDALEPVAVTESARELFDDVPTIERDEGLVWQAFEDGEAIFADDIQDEAGAYNPETPIGSELMIPAGEHGVFVAASTEVEGFDAIDEELAGVLVSNLARAIDSVRREHRLRERERELEQYETIVRAIPDEVYTLDEEGRFTSIIPPTGSERTTSGYAPDELVGEHVSKVLDDDAIARGQELIAELLRSDERERGSFEMEVISRDGERVPNENHVALLPTEQPDGFRGTVGVLRNIEERLARERELQRQNERLEEFASIASHDLRNPLNVAQGNLDLACDDCESDHLGTVADALDRMERLIDDTLTMAKGGQSVTATEPVALDDLVARSWTAVATDDATLEVVDDARVAADPERLTRVFANLLRNAVEHGGHDVSVRVGMIDGDGFYVADDGPGIPASERSAVFDAGHTTDDDGTGFGLAIVAEVVEAHGWEITVADSEYGGTRFEITGVEFV